MDISFDFFSEDQKNIASLSFEPSAWGYKWDLYKLTIRWYFNQF